MAIFDVDLYEPVSAQVTADSGAYSADNTTWPTADGGLLDGAHDYADAEVIAAFVPVGGMVRPLQRLLPVEGNGYGVLPALEGEGYGFVVLAGSAKAFLSQLSGEANGAVGASGKSLGQLFDVRATAIGVRGETGAGSAGLKAMAIRSAGAITVYGAGVGSIVKFGAAAIGQHDDEEAAIMTLLLAA